MSTHETIIAIYDGFETANVVLQALLDEGFLRGDVGLAVSNPNGNYNNLDFRFQRYEESAVDEKGFNVLLANLAGTTFALTSILIPGLGPVVAAGSLGDVLSETTGSVVGGVTASLVHLGIPQNEAGIYAEALQRGYALITVYVRTDMAMDLAMDVLLHNQPMNVKNSTDKWGGFDERVETYYTMPEAVGRFPSVSRVLS